MLSNFMVPYPRRIAKLQRIIPIKIQSRSRGQQIGGQKYGDIPIGEALNAGAISNGKSSFPTRAMTYY
ncbi:MAG: hypothetical protein ABS69_07970 [Nitrosomonadales bacterium SCN 54-20]|nr:MAG: hypothetical protein ABS69_07970 [Nitrosomonadales bacterium SCN 54-20]